MSDFSERRSREQGGEQPSGKGQTELGTQSEPPETETISDAICRSDFPARGRLLGLDFGTKRLGLALSNAEQTIATPLETYLRRDPLQDQRHLVEKVDEHNVVGLVVGLPVHMSGDEGEKAREARAFGLWAAQITQRPLLFSDERYTTALADEHLRAAHLGPKKRQSLRDMLAAQILLQGFLDNSRRGEAPGALR
ncbi:MAG TPA: Holliday junction resolvase RuvX [Planctomycetaceae bacterium]|nr:Holliday junction resolvase RuvX [Planctomycetaceae bacterium]